MAASGGAASRLNAQSDDRLAIGSECSPHGSPPIIDGSVPLGPGRRRQDIDNTYAAPLLGEVDARPLAPGASELHMRFLDLTARELFFDVEIESNQPEDNRDRLGIFVRGLDGEGIDDVLQDKSGAAHSVNVDLVVRGAQCIHCENSVPKGQDDASYHS
jgi:hypothetical protein